MSVTQLTLEQPGDHHFIRSVSADGVLVGETHYRGNLLIAAATLEEDWGPASLDAIEDKDFEPILALDPEVVLLGTGANQQFLPPAKLAPCHRAGVGVELMTTDAACRTFNVLATEGRRVVAALFPV